MPTHAAPVPPRRRIPLLNWVLIVLAAAVVVSVPAYLFTRPSPSAAVFVAPTSGDAGVPEPETDDKPVPSTKTIKGYTYPDDRCVNGWPPDSTWVGVGKYPNGKLGVVTFEELNAWAIDPNASLNDVPNVDIYCPPGTKVP